MPMPPYPMLCYHKGCESRARFKIAASWSDGVTSELKTYGLSCEKCLNLLFQDALTRRQSCRLAPGELLDRPRVYFLAGSKGQELDPKQLRAIETSLGEAVLSPPQPVTPR